MYRRIGIVVKRNSDRALEIARDLCRWLGQRGCEPVPDKETGSALGLDGRSRDEVAGEADLVVVLGGDGTLLSTARSAGKRPVPILGVNLGGLGFITEVPPDRLYPTLNAVFQGRNLVEERIRFNVEVTRDGETVAANMVLNDAVINRGALSRIVGIEISVSGTFLTAYRADGLICATPTGSTAYNLSAGGPILYPTLDGMVLTPICPHTLSQRPIVLPVQGGWTVQLKADGEASLTLDGQVGVDLRPGDLVELSRAEYPTRLLIPEDRNYFEILRTKLGWGGEC